MPTALDDAAFKDLIVGKSTWVKNTVTGEVFSIVWTQSGQRLINNINGTIPQPERGWRCVSRRHAGRRHGV